jgi:acetyltransferase-like isoleucine patch superfamily enzyme
LAPVTDEQARGGDADQPTRVAPSACIEPGATVGEGTAVWDNSQIRAGARVGRYCTIGRNVFIDAGVVVADACKVQNNALIYAPARLETGVFIGPAVVLTNDRNPRAVDASMKPLTTEHWRVQGVVVNEGASVGAGAVVVAGTTIGAWALVAAGAVVSADVLPHALVGGVPARQLGWVGHAGVRLVPDGDLLVCPATGVRYRRSGDQLEALA